MSGGTEFQEQGEVQEQPREVSEETKRVEQATTEPEAVVERQGDYQQAEQVETAFKEVVQAAEATVDGRPETGDGNMGLGDQETGGELDPDPVDAGEVKTTDLPAGSSAETVMIDTVPLPESPAADIAADGGPGTEDGGDATWRPGDGETGRESEPAGGTVTESEMDPDPVDAGEAEQTGTDPSEVSGVAEGDGSAAPAFQGDGETQLTDFFDQISEKESLDQEAQVFVQEAPQEVATSPAPQESTAPGADTSIPTQENMKAEPSSQPIQAAPETESISSGEPNANTAKVTGAVPPQGAGLTVDDDSETSSLSPDTGSGVGRDAVSGGLETQEAISTGERVSESALVDVNALVQSVLREAYLENTQDLRFYADKVKYFNECKKQVRDYLNQIREQAADIKDNQELTIPITVTEDTEDGSSSDETQELNLTMEEAVRFLALEVEEDTPGEGDSDDESDTPPPPPPPDTGTGVSSNLPGSGPAIGDRDPGVIGRVIAETGEEEVTGRPEAEDESTAAKFDPTNGLRDVESMEEEEPVQGLTDPEIVRQLIDQLPESAAVFTDQAAAEIVELALADSGMDFVSPIRSAIQDQYQEISATQADGLLAASLLKAAESLNTGEMPDQPPDPGVETGINPSYPGTDPSGSGDPGLEPPPIGDDRSGLIDPPSPEDLEDREAKQAAYDEYWNQVAGQLLPDLQDVNAPAQLMQMIVNIVKNLQDEANALIENKK